MEFENSFFWKSFSLARSHSPALSSFLNDIDSWEESFIRRSNAPFSVNPFVSFIIWCVSSIRNHSFIFPRYIGSWEELIYGWLCLCRRTHFSPCDQFRLTRIHWLLWMAIEDRLLDKPFWLQSPVTKASSLANSAVHPLALFVIWRWWCHATRFLREEPANTPCLANLKLLE